jgi:protein tyrosine phosphatase (PTP) superfamily phosphohydrolase (DUF442 family)
MDRIARRYGHVFALMLLVLGAASATSFGGTEVKLEVDSSKLPVAIEDVEGVERNLYLDGRVYIGGQPTEAALQTLKELGVTAVVNLRTPGEMDDRERVPYDEATAARGLELDYIWIPLGGEDHPYTPAALDKFAEVLERHDGRVLLHCTMGWRAAYVWVAYLIREHGFALDDAYARGEAIAIGKSPLEGLLDRPLTIAYE